MIDLDKVKLHLVQDTKDIQAFLRWLDKRRPVLACDTETSGLQWWNGNLRLVQFGDFRAGWVIPWEDWAGLVREVFASYNGPVVFHNKKFDLHWLERNKVVFPEEKIHDTATMLRLLEPNLSAALKPAAVRHIDSRLAGAQDDLKHMMSKHGWTWGTIPISYDPYWQYAALDTVLTAALYEALEPHLTGSTQELYELEGAVSNIIRRVEDRGVRINVPYVKDQMKRLAKALKKLSEEITATYGVRPGSNREVARALLEDGIELDERTAGGDYSVTADVLEEVQHPLAEKVLDFRRTQKILNAYFRHLASDHDNGYIHADINPLAARTGRMSISDPPLQQIPVRTGKTVRDAFIPSEGNLFVDVDFDQIEQRLIATYSKEEAMIRAFHQADQPGGIDMFTNLARQLYQDDTLEKNDRRRSMTKNTAYGKAYGASAARIAVTAKVSTEEAEAFVALYDRTFPGVDRFMQSAKNAAAKREDEEGYPYVINFYGRRLAVPSERLYAALNYIIQGTASDFFKRKLLELDEADLSQFVVLPVHDEFLADVPAEQAQEVAKEMERILQEPNIFAVPITASAQIGKSWGEVH